MDPIIDELLYQFTLIENINITSDEICRYSSLDKDNSLIIKYNELSEDNKKIFNYEYVKFLLFNQYNIRDILITINNKNNVSWYTLNKKVNKNYIKHTIYKTLFKKLQICLVNLFKINMLVNTIKHFNYSIIHCRIK